MRTTKRKVLTAKPAQTAHSDCLRCSKLILVGRASLTIHGKDSAKQTERKPTSLCRKRKRIGQLCFRRRIRSRCLLLQSLFGSVRIRYVYFALIMLSLCIMNTSPRRCSGNALPLIQVFPFLNNEHVLEHVLNVFYINSTIEGNGEHS